MHCVWSTGALTSNTLCVSFFPQYASKGHEYFDVYSPEIATTYGENYWTSMGVHPLPDHIVKRFKGKVIAITGYEMDQVMVEPVGQPGVDPSQDLSVPINWAYNHHYMCWMTGEHSSMTEIVAEPGDTSAHGAPTKWIAADKPSAASRSTMDAPTSLLFSEGNGGESRKSFHGYPKGFAQLLSSPTSWHLTPMQIDTRRRDCGVGRDAIHNCTKFEPWIEPKQARYGRHVSQSNYSGVLECPCNSRFGGDPIFYPDAQTKRIEHEYDALAAGGACPSSKKLADAQSCFVAGHTLGLSSSKVVNVTIADAAQPSGCFATALANGSVAVTFNRAASSTAACPSGNVRSGEATSLVNVTLKVSLDPTPAGGLATISITGPASAWFGAGLNAMHMADAPYTIVCNGSGAFEQQIGTCGSEAEHCIGDRLPTQSLTLLSNTVVDGMRTLVVTRAFRGASRKHYTFDPTKLSSLNFITAVGRTQVFAYHKAHHAARLTMLAPAGNATCLCDDGLVGHLCKHGGVGCTSFVKNCVHTWDGDAEHSGGDLFQQANPTCNSMQYSGGLSCCGHRRVMLDHDQDPGPSLLRYHMKYRFWFDEYKEGKPTPGAYVSRPGALPRGFDALPPATVTVDAAMATCAATANCTGITFAAAEPKAGGAPVKVYFKNGTTLTNGQDGWQSWVVDKPVSHHHLPRFYYQTEANAGEYDVPPAFRRAGDPPIPGYPKVPISSAGDLHLTPGSTCTGTCPDGPDCACVHTITQHWTMSNSRMIYAGGHCHAPSCISIELYRNDSGTPELLCRQTSQYGQGHVKADKFDEVYAPLVTPHHPALPIPLASHPHPLLPTPHPSPPTTPISHHPSPPHLHPPPHLGGVRGLAALPLGGHVRGPRRAELAARQHADGLNQAQPQHTRRALW